MVGSGSHLEARRELGVPRCGRDGERRHPRLVHGSANGRWSVWYRASSDLGRSWSPAVRISDATSGTAYKNAKGFLEAYGDYGEMDITNTGKVVAVWGEGASYNGPGGVWFNRQT